MITQNSTEESIYHSSSGKDYYKKAKKTVCTSLTLKSDKENGVKVFFLNICFFNGK